VGPRIVHESVPAACARCADDDRVGSDRRAGRRAEGRGDRGRAEDRVGHPNAVGFIGESKTIFSRRNACGIRVIRVIRGSTVDELNPQHVPTIDGLIDVTSPGRRSSPDTAFTVPGCASIMVSLCRTRVAAAVQRASRCCECSDKDNG